MAEGEEKEEVCHENRLKGSHKWETTNVFKSFKTVYSSKRTLPPVYPSARHGRIVQSEKHCRSW